MSLKKMTLGLSIHRPEMIPYIADSMHQHEAIFLEEPHDDGFGSMLEGKLAVDNYLMELDVEYPTFSRQMCYVLKDLKAKGKKIFQVEPFLEILLNIHEFFSEGNTPGDLRKDSIHYPVYLAERNATGALLVYYQTVMSGSFEQTIEAVIRFARMDADRFRLRDSLRAQSLSRLVVKYSTSYIEAGLIHYQLWRLLCRKVSKQVQGRLEFTADADIKRMGEKSHLYGPGDQLTLLYVFNPNKATEERERLLAARSLIYSKIVAKEELTRGMGKFPHLHDELDCIRTTKRLSLDDCRQLFPKVRGVNSSDARKIVFEYVGSQIS